MAATETIGPFDNATWSQDQWYRYAATWAPSGVVDVPAASPSTGGLALSFNGLTPTLAAGRAWVRGAGYELAGGSKTLTAVTANTNASYSRRDRIVLRRDLAAKTLTPVQLQGTPASSPSAPALTQVETGQWDIPLFSFLVPPNSGTTITGIVDERPWLSPDPTFTALTANNAGWTFVSGHTPKGRITASGTVRLNGWTQNVNLFSPNFDAYMLNLPAGLPVPATRQIFNITYASPSNGYGLVSCSLLPAGDPNAGQFRVDLVVNGTGPSPIPANSTFFLDGIEYSPSYAG